jgi:dGTPase
VDTNAFYTDFDYADLDGLGRAPDEYRTPFQRDRDRIIHTSAFRRLQAKTQVFLSGEYDFYRTRLTHSIEVAQIGRSICYHLKQASELLKPDFYIDPDLVEAICLTHDLGHPPFGHAGERSLNQMLANYGGFEGNAQTLRIITRTIYSSGGNRRGMSPSRAFIDGVLKYKTLHKDHPEKDHHFLYDDQAAVLDFVYDGAPFPADLPPGKARNGFHSIECQIMDWADDTAYSTNDLVDGINAGYITIEKIERWAEKKALDPDRQKHLEDVMQAMRKQKVEAHFGHAISAFIHGARLVERSGFMSERTNRHRFSLEIDPAVNAQRNVYKDLAVDLIFRSPQINQLEYKGDRMLRQIFQVLTQNYLDQPDSAFRLLPMTLEDQVRAEHSIQIKARMIADYVAGMSDSFTQKTYQRLCESGFGSIGDFV